MFCSLEKSLKSNQLMSQIVQFLFDQIFDTILWEHQPFELMYYFDHL